ncbi:hypothetical protein [Arcticibacter tournemirensis]|uniref:hypothetical protein n=1 Tax=Arcticibacter tournemirensis TaxID=699437 RepID=UPI0011500DCA|nr:hypothetical protein [Arcticibacter tournemirensis]
MMKKFAFPVVLFILISCRTSQSIPGYYNRYTEHLKLEKDSTFEYNKAYDLAGVSAYGLWSAGENGEVFLKSDYDYERLPLTVVESRTTGTGTRIEIKEEQPGAMSSWKGTIYSSFYINSHKFTREYLGPMITDSVFNVKTIQVEIRYKDSLLRSTTGFIRDRVGTIRYNVQDSSANNFVVSIPLKSHFMASLVVCDTLYLKGKKLIWPAKGKYPFKKIKVRE